MAGLTDFGLDTIEGVRVRKNVRVVGTEHITSTFTVECSAAKLPEPLTALRASWYIDLNVSG